MSLILSGSDGLSDIDGSAATPAIRGTDANTGIFFGTDIIGFSEGGVECARFNADSQFVAAAGTAALPVITTTGDTNTGIFFPAADTIAFSEGGAEAMRIDSSGNVGIGTTAPADKLHVAISSAGLGGIRVQNTNASGQAALSYYNDTATQKADIWWNNSGSTLNLRTLSTDPMIFSTNNAERMRIDSSGYVLVNKTSATTYGGIYAQAYTSNTSGQKWLQVFDSTVTAGSCQGLYVTYTAAAPNGTGNEFIFCNDSGGIRFQTRSNGGVANYSGNNANLSDRREKINFAPAKSYLDVICAIPVQTFNYIDQNREEDDGLTLGVVAQDVQAVAPELVSESDWSSEKDGSKMRLSIYQTDLQYALMKCIQEQQALITALTARITALETP